MLFKRRRRSGDSESSAFGFVRSSESDVGSSIRKTGVISSEGREEEFLNKLQYGTIIVGSVIIIQNVATAVIDPFC